MGFDLTFQLSDNLGLALTNMGNLKANETTTQPEATEAFGKNPLLNHWNEVANVKDGAHRFQVLFETVVSRFEPVVARIDYRQGISTEQKGYADSDLTPELIQKLMIDWLEPVINELQCEQDPRPVIVQYTLEGQDLFIAACPIYSNVGEIDGAIGMLLDAESNSPEMVIAELEALVLAAAIKKTEAKEVDGTSGQLHALKKAASFESTREFAFSLVNLVADQYRCEQVAFAEVAGEQAKMIAISGLATFKANSPGVADIAQAAEECRDHDQTIIFQPNDDSFDQGFRLHQQWSQATGDSCVCSLPLKHNQQIVAVISLRRDTTSPWTPEELADLDRRVGGFGPAVALVRKANASTSTLLKNSINNTLRKCLLPKSFGKKMMLGLLFLFACYFCFGSTTYAPSCKATLVPENVTQISSPFQAVLKEKHVKPGDRVSKGQLLFELKTEELKLELAEVEGELGVAQTSLRESLAEEDVTAAALFNQQVQALTARRAALISKIDRSKVYAPTDGVITQSKLESQIGQVFEIGDSMLEFASVDQWKVKVEAPDYVASYLQKEQQATFSAAARPGKKFQFEVEQLNHSAEVSDGKNVFLVKGKLNESEEWMKSGMNGFARIKTVKKPVWWVSLHRVLDYARINFWL